MNNLNFFLFMVLFVCSCTNKYPKPENLIPEDKMIDILYDVNILHSISRNNNQTLKSYDLNPEKFIYKKYNIDSLQFVENHLYYISNIDNYEKMIEKITERIQNQIDSLSQKTDENIPTE